MTNLIVVKGVRQYLKKHKMMLGEGTTQTLELLTAKIIDQAIVTALKDKKTTIYPKFFPQFEVRVTAQKLIDETPQENTEDENNEDDNHHLPLSDFL